LTSSLLKVEESILLDNSLESTSILEEKVSKELSFIESMIFSVAVSSCFNDCSSDSFNDSLIESGILEIAFEVSSEVCLTLPNILLSLSISLLCAVIMLSFVSESDCSIFWLSNVHIMV